MRSPRSAKRSPATAASTSPTCAPKATRSSKGSTRRSRSAGARVRRSRSITSRRPAARTGTRCRRSIARIDAARARGARRHHRHVPLCRQRHRPLVLSAPLGWRPAASSSTTCAIRRCAPRSARRCSNPTGDWEAHGDQRRRRERHAGRLRARSTTSSTPGSGSTRSPRCATSTGSIPSSTCWPTRDSVSRPSTSR